MLDQCANFSGIFLIFLRIFNVFFRQKFYNTNLGMSHFTFLYLSKVSITVKFFKAGEDNKYSLDISLEPMGLCPIYPIRFKMYIVFIFSVTFAFPMIIISFSYFKLLMTVKV